MTVTIEAVRDGLADRLRTIPDLRVHYAVPGTINPPAAILTLESINYDTSMDRGSDDLVFVAQMLTSIGSDRAGQSAVLAYLNGSGDYSVKKAIDDDETLAGVAHFAVVEEARAPGITEYGGNSYFAAEVVIRVGVQL